MPNDLGAHPGEGNEPKHKPRLLVRFDGKVCELAAIAIESIEPHSTISDVPGSVLGMALIRGQVVPVLQLSSDPGPLVVGCVRGEVIALSGLQVIGWVAEESAVRPELHATNHAEVNAEASCLDVEELLAHMAP